MLRLVPAAAGQRPGQKMAASKIGKSGASSWRARVAWRGAFIVLSSARRSRSELAEIRQAWRGESQAVSERMILDPGSNRPARRRLAGLRPRQQTGYATAKALAKVGENPYKIEAPRREHAARRAWSRRQSVLARFAFVHYHVVAAAVAPNAQQGGFVFGIFCQMHRILGSLDRVTVDFLDHVAGLKAGLRRR